MRHFVFSTFVCLMLVACQNYKDDKRVIDTTLNAWHKAAAQADFNTYFGLMHEDAIFIGTDATERWTKPEFENYAKPYFDKGKAWRFNPLQRTIYVDTYGETAWFDELLDTSFKICRGSGVVIKTNSGWKVSHYVLSMTVPNELAKEVVHQKDSIESILIFEMKKTTTQK